MLNLVWLPRQSSHRKQWEAFDPETQIWVTHDRKTKQFLTQSLLDRREIIGDQVKRAKEFYRELLRSADPEMKILEDLGTRIRARDFLLTHGTSEWCGRPHAPRKLIDACESLAPLLTHELADEFLRDIENDFKRIAGPFLDLCRLGRGFYVQALEERRMPLSFLPFFLAQADGELCSGRDIVFDLGFDLRAGEKELMRRLSSTNEVTVLIPAAGREQLDGPGLAAYRDFDLGLAKVQERVAVIPASAKTEAAGTSASTAGSAVPMRPLELWRCSSPEAEARKAVEKVAQWIARGVKPKDICITASRFSDYENILSHDLAWEGVGLNRKIQTVLSASRLFRALGARLQIVKGGLQASIIEEAFLSVAVYKKTVQRREERRVLNPILHESQIPHAKLRSDIESLRQKKQTKMSVAKFEDLVIDIFKDLMKEVSRTEDPLEAEERNRLFLGALGRLRTEIGDAVLDLNQWIEAWQEVVNSIRLPVQAPIETGVWGVDLASVGECPAAHLIILGAAEQAGGPSIVVGLSEEKLRYLREKGFDLAAAAGGRNDPLMPWILTGDHEEVVLSCPKTDSAGQSISANSLWLRAAAREGRDLDKLDFAHATTWAETQRSILSAETAAQVDVFKNWKAGTAAQIGSLCSEELAGTRLIQLDPFEARPLPFSLTVSKMEAYWSCPYKFFAASMLRLQDEEDLEVEPSASKQGQWLHSAVEKILSDNRALDSWQDENLADLIDTLDEVQKQVSSDIWSNIRSRFVRRLRRFVDYEIQWRKEQPRARPARLEAPVQGFLEWKADAAEIEFRSTQPLDLEVAASNSYWGPFSGKIDRIDETAGGKGIILDYKSSSYKVSNIPAWADKGNFQLALYSEAVEAGLQEAKPRAIIAGLYYTLKNPQRDRGYVVIDEDLAGILPPGPRQASVSAEKRREMFGAINKEVQGVLEKMRSGAMTPMPHDEKMCKRCSWRTSCRAAHLS